MQQPGGMNEMPLIVLTIGHSAHTLEKFAELLRQHRVQELADVRSAPYSRYASHFNRGALERSLREHGIEYVFLGRELGVRSKNPSYYDKNGRVQYGRLKRTDIFRSGIERVVREAGNRRIALMCAEKDPLDCHRAILVAPVLREKGLCVRHILADGSLEDHEDSMKRLLAVLGLSPLSLFPESEQELIERALKKQGKRIAYHKEETGT